MMRGAKTPTRFGTKPKRVVRRPGFRIKKLTRLGKTVTADLVVLHRADAKRRFDVLFHEHGEVDHAGGFGIQFGVTRTAGVPAL